MKTILPLLLSILALVPLHAADPTPVPRPQPTSYSPSAAATTISVKWYYYAVYLEALVAARDAEIATLKNGVSQPPTSGGDLATKMNAVLEQQKAINANTAALAERYHTILNPKLDAILAKVGTGTEVLGPRIDGIASKVEAIDTRLQTVVPPTKNTVFIPDGVKQGSNITLKAVADGVPAPSYVWQKNGVPIPGATTDQLPLTNVQLTDSAKYTVIASNVAGSASNSDLLVVIP